MVRNKFNKIIIKSITIASILTMITPNIITATRFTQSVTSRDPDTTTTDGNQKTIIVLDPGHGKSSLLMNDSEKTSEGYVQNGSQWGEWRHWKDGTYGDSCQESGCTGSGSSCWYSIGAGDRDTEPTLNLNNANAAKKYLEQMGYEVRMTRTSNEQNPSFTKRAAYCFNSTGDINNTSQTPDAELYVCIHSNALNGSATGTAYMHAGGSYKQSYIPSDYAERCNKAGELINNKVAEATGLENDGAINGQEWLIAFNKNPVPTAYLEIGFYDNSSDLAILQSKSDAIGKAIAEGIHEYLETVGKASKTEGTPNSNGTTASKGTITISSNEEKFLGLWKNSEGKYVPYYEDAEKAKYNPNGKIVKYGTYGSAAGAILNADYWLFDLLSATDRTQQHLQLMKYLMQEYSRYKLWGRI